MELKRKNLNRPYHLTNDECVRASTLLEEGRSMRYVANVLGVNHSRVSRMVKRFRETASHSRKRRQERQHVLRNRYLTSTELSDELQTVRNVRISALAVRKRLKDAGLSTTKAAIAPLITAARKVARLKFARNHANWTVDKWKKVLFIDEARISLKSPDGRANGRMAKAWRKIFRLHYLSKGTVRWWV